MAALPLPRRRARARCSLLAGGGDTEADADLPPGSRDNSKEVEEYYKTKVALPPDVFDAFERGDITQEEIDQRTAAGEFPKFFHEATPADLPADLVWENGMDLPDFGSPEAKKGGTVFMSIQDYPRTLRLVGPDANGSFRAYILDDTAMRFARRHPNVTDVTPTGHRLFPGIAKEWAIDRRVEDGLRPHRSRGAGGRTASRSPPRTSSSPSSSTSRATSTRPGTTTSTTAPSPASPATTTSPSR